MRHIHVNRDSLLADSLMYVLKSTYTGKLWCLPKLTYCVCVLLNLASSEKEMWISVISAGGQWLITDMRRGETIFEIDPSLQVSHCLIILQLEISDWGYYFWKCHKPLPCQILYDWSFTLLCHIIQNIHTYMGIPIVCHLSMTNSKKFE